MLSVFWRPTRVSSWSLAFAFYIDDITKTLLSSGSTLVLYVDDVLLYNTISVPQDFLHVQSDLDSLHQWSVANHLALNPQKCKTMILSRKRLPFRSLTPLQINGSVLEVVKSFKYLGVIITDNLSWLLHIDSVCSKARKIIGLLYRQFYPSSSFTSMKQLYLSLVRPHLEYAAQLWDPYLKGDIDKLECVQKFALRLILHRWDIGYDELLVSVNIPSLQQRRLNLKLVQDYKILHYLCYFPSGFFTLQPYYSNRLARSDSLLCPFAKTKNSTVHMQVLMPRGNLCS